MAEDCKSLTYHFTAKPMRSALCGADQNARTAFCCTSAYLTVSWLLQSSEMFLAVQIAVLT